MPSAAGKRVVRVLAGCSKPEAGDKPGLPSSTRSRDGTRHAIDVVTGIALNSTLLLGNLVT